jgi:sulfite oxidase
MTAEVFHPRKLDYTPGTFEALKDVHNRPDEWKIEQGLSGAQLPFLDQTGPETIFVHPAKPATPMKDEAAIKAVGNPNELFQMERPGWKG